MKPSLVVAPDDRTDSATLTLRSLADSDAAAIQAMLDDPDVREAMCWTDDEHRNAAQVIATAQAEQVSFYRAVVFLIA